MDHGRDCPDVLHRACRMGTPSPGSRTWRGIQARIGASPVPYRLSGLGDLTNGARLASLTTPGISTLSGLRSRQRDGTPCSGNDKTIRCRAVIAEELLSYGFLSAPLPIPVQTTSAASALSSMVWRACTGGMRLGAIETPQESQKQTARMYGSVLRRGGLDRCVDILLRSVSSSVHETDERKP